jgi:hypothetical protein
MTRDDALKLLGLDGQASAQAIEQRYHELYNDYHLRLDQAPTLQLKQLYQGKLQEVEAAYQAVRGEEGKAGVADLPGLTPVYEPRLSREPQRESGAEPRREPEPREEAQRRETKPTRQEPSRGGWRWVIGVVVGVVVLGAGIWGMGEYQRLEGERERLAWEREVAERQRREAEERAAEAEARRRAEEDQRRQTGEMVGYQPASFSWAATTGWIPSVGMMRNPGGGCR